MELNEIDSLVVAAMVDGLPLCARPFKAIGERVGLGEAQVIGSLAKMRDGGVIKRFGLIVRHHELGYRANAMSVWNIPDDRVDAVGRCFGKFDFVTLCYRRPRHLPEWPYNLFCMVHGRERTAVQGQVDQLAIACGLENVGRDVLFSTRRFKQCGARYGTTPRQLETVA